MTAPEAAALATLDAFMAALNRRDEPALNGTLHFPHVRLARGRLAVWDTPGTYRIADFLGRACLASRSRRRGERTWATAGTRAAGTSAR